MSYSYDGSGKRVRKVDGQGETVFVYDAFGKLVAEYATIIDSRPKATSYLTTDDLGSPRIVTNQLGQVVSRHDYLPFGEEVLAGVGGRTTLQGYGGNDGVRKQFTGYERDTESGLDYAQARYFKAGHGRFTSVDPLAASVSIKNPQTLNRYTYGLNSPYKFTDPLGLAPCGNVNSSGTFGNACTQADDVKDKCPPGSNCLEPCKTSSADCIPGSDRQIATVDVSAADTPSELILDSGSTQVGTAISLRGVPNPGLDIANADPLQSVEGIARLSEAGSALPGIGIPFAAIAGITRSFQGDASGGGTNLLGIIPGFSIFKRAGQAANVVGDVVAATNVEQYALRAARDGLYPVMQRGSAAPVGEAFLKAGDVWKFGVTKNPGTRYSQTFLTNTGQGLVFSSRAQFAARSPALQLEKQLLLNYRSTFGHLPPGNKILR